MTISSTSQQEVRVRHHSSFTQHFIKYLKWASCFFAVLGGVLLASKIEVSGYGFLFLAMSSSHMLLASCLLGDKSMMGYSGAVFLFVDCLGVYRWLLS